jgi:UDP-GlcNAc3NAcA epimerase
MIKLITIVGARPQFIKAAALNRIIRARYTDSIEEIIVHTGQHYDAAMSQLFFDELELTIPKYNLNVGSQLHAEQTAAMMNNLEKILLAEKPNAVIVYGDTNSTLAGALTASKLHIPVVHIEAGLRSFNKNMPEEINRIVADTVSTLLFTPTLAGYYNLLNEGFKEGATEKHTINNPKVYHSGDVMYDNALYYSEKMKSEILLQNKLNENDYVLTTIHRAENTDNNERLTSIFETINELSLDHKLKFVLPLHPRTIKMLQLETNKQLYNKIQNNDNLKIISPTSYTKMLLLEKNAKIVMTDSGGVQKEAYFFNKPCIVLRKETEWVELVENNAAILANADAEKIKSAFEKVLKLNNVNATPLFGDGNAASFIVEKILSNFQ